jgi:membrane fusion protein (multidrug efflux system)
VDEAAHVDFAIPQQVGRGLKAGDTIEIIGGPGEDAVGAEIVALDSRVDPLTRNTTVRARISDARLVPPPGASVRVRVPSGPALAAVGIPVSALRKGAGGDHVFVIVPDDAGQSRARLRRVETGPTLGDEVLVLSGLKAGERVVANGSFKLRESVLVAVVPGDDSGASLN